MNIECLCSFKRMKKIVRRFKWLIDTFLDSTFFVSSRTVKIRLLLPFIHWNMRIHAYLWKICSMNPFTILMFYYIAHTIILGIGTLKVEYNRLSLTDEDLIFVTGSCSLLFGDWFRWCERTWQCWIHCTTRVRTTWSGSNWKAPADLRCWCQLLLNRWY